VINYTTFYHYDIFNRSSTTIDSFVKAMFVDVDLGNYADDRIGSNPGGGYAYVYNGDADDDGPEGYGTNPPAFGVAVIASDTSFGKASKVMYYDNDSDPVDGNPRQVSDYWNYMNGRFRNGSPLTYGGNGMGGSSPADFFFPGTKDPLSRPDWSEITAGKIPGDRRFIIASPGMTIAPGGKSTVDFAFVYSRTTSAASPVLDKLETDIARVQSWFRTQNFPGCTSLNGIATEERNHESVRLYPNPSSNSITIDLSQNMGFNADVLDLSGRLVYSFTAISGQPIHIGRLTQGIYFVRIKTPDAMHVLKFVRN
jgi:hypothetical protein